MGKRSIITISREFGSAGRTIGRLAAEKLGYDFYDVELVKKVAAQTGFDEKYVERVGEYAPSSNRFAYAFAARDLSGLSVDDKVWLAQLGVILELAEKGNCVIVGRCADYLLRDYKDCLHVFIHAPAEVRAKRIVELYGERDDTPENRLIDKDTRRAINYKYRTGREWGKAQNYDLCLDSNRLGIEYCAALIAEVASGKPELPKDEN